ncbi:MFS transporter [Candidatus Poribacteria bacterium]|nr:MFS transporter [Candidatus Poribacteria bacterium]
MKWRYYHTVWSVLVFGWVTNYMIRIGFSPVLRPIMEEFKITHADAGLLATAFFIAYAVMQFPAGHLGDRVGRKVMLTISSFGWAIAALLTGLTRSYVQLFVCRLITGLTEGSYFGGDRPVIAAYTPKEKMGLGQGVSFIGLGIGMCLGILLAGMIADVWGWRIVFILFSLPAFVAGFLILTLIKEPAKSSGNLSANPDTRETSSSPQESSKPSEGQGHGTSYKLVIKSRDLWMLYLGGIPSIYALFVVGTWAPKILQDIGVKSLANASIYSSLLGIAAIPGLMIMGYISDKLYQRGFGKKCTVVVAFIMLALFMGLMGYAIDSGAPVWIFVVYIFISGFFVWGMWAPIFSIIAGIVPQEIRGTVYGLTNGINFIGAIVAPWLTGWIKDFTGSFAWGPYSAGIMLVIGAILIMAIRPVFRLGKEVSVMPKDNEGRK